MGQEIQQLFALRKKMPVMIVIAILLTGTSFWSFAQNIPTPRAKIHCPFDGNWYTPEEFRIYCRPPQVKPSVTPRSPQQQMQLQMIKSVLQPLFSALFNFNYLFLPQKTDEQIKKGEETNQTTEAWERYLQEAKRRAEKELEERKKAGESILQKVGMGTTLSPVKTQPSLSPIDWDHPRGKLESSADSVKEELLRTVYFSKMAETALSNGDLEAARFWATFAFEGPSISPRDIDYKPPKELINAMDSRKAVEMSRRLAQNSRLFKEVLPKFDVLQETIAKMEEIKIKREISEKRLKEVEEEIKRMELQKKTAQTPTEKNELDDLLRRTIALKHEIDAEYQKVLDDEQKLIRQKEVIEKELNELKMRFTEVMR